MLILMYNIQLFLLCACLVKLYNVTYHEPMEEFSCPVLNLRGKLEMFAQFKKEQNRVATLKFHAVISVLFSRRFLDI